MTTQEQLAAIAEIRNLANQLEDAYMAEITKYEMMGGPFSFSEMWTYAKIKEALSACRIISASSAFNLFAIPNKD